MRIKSKICVFIAILVMVLFIASSCCACPSETNSIKDDDHDHYVYSSASLAYLDVEKTVSYNVVEGKTGPIVYKKGINKYPDDLTVRLTVGPKGHGISGHADMVLVIDDSGSMSWYDPNNIRVSAARRVVQNNFTYCDRGAVVIFESSAELAPRGSQAHHLNTMGHYGVPHSYPPRPGEGYDCLRNTDLASSNFYSSGGTDYVSALRVAIPELTTYGYDGVHRTCPGCGGSHKLAMIFLSDGEPNSESGLWTEVDRARNAGIHIFTIGLGDQVANPGTSGYRILRDMALRTNGAFFPISSPSQIDPVYVRIIGMLRDVVAQPAPTMNDIILQEVLPKAIEFVPGSNVESTDARFLGPQYFKDYTILEWALGGTDKKIKVGEPNIQITYKIKALATEDVYKIKGYVATEYRSKDPRYGDPGAINPFSVYSVITYKNITNTVNYTYPMLLNGYSAPDILPAHLSKNNRFIKVIAPKPKIAPVPPILPPIAPATFGGGIAVLNPALIGVQISTLTSVVTGSLVGQAIATTTPVVLTQALATSMVTSVALGSPLGLLVGLGMMERVRLKRKVRAMQVAVKPREEIPKVIGE